MEEIYEKLNRFIEEERWDEIEPFLTGCMDRAREEEAHGVYIACGNELLDFYRQTGRFDGAFLLAEDLLVLMEELQLEDTEHFALVLVNAAAAYDGAGRLEEAARYYERAARILERRLEAAGSSEGDWEHRRVEELLAEVLTRLALCTASGQEKDAQGASRFRDSIYGQKSALFSRALSLFEKNEGNERSAQEQSQFELYYLTCLAGLGEAAWTEGKGKEALHFYEKASAKSEQYMGASEGTRVLRENCEKLATMMQEEEEES